MIGKEINKYKILSKIGDWEMGFVFLGEHLTLRRKAAIKFLNPIFAKNPETRQRFINAALTLAQLSHKNIVALYDYAETDDELFLILEYNEGNPLDVFVNQLYGPIPEKMAKVIFMQILSGFSFAHDKGIIHYAIKPSNILLKPDFTPKILDFGIANMISLNSLFSQEEENGSSIIYSSPEQVQGGHLDNRTDIYSLGLTLFEMLTGQKVFNTPGNNEYSTRSRILYEPLPPASKINPAVSPFMEYIIAKATHKTPTARFQNCEEFAQAFNEVTNMNTQRKIFPTIQEPEKETNNILENEISKEDERAIVSNEIDAINNSVKENKTQNSELKLSNDINTKVDNVINPTKNNSISKVKKSYSRFYIILGNIAAVVIISFIIFNLVKENDVSIKSNTEENNTTKTEGDFNIPLQNEKQDSVLIRTTYGDKLITQDSALTGTNITKQNKGKTVKRSATNPKNQNTSRTTKGTTRFE